MSTPTFLYPFDPTGTAATNKITAERQVISPPNWSEFYFIVPLVAPYFRESLRVIHRPSGRLLVEGVDYVCTHRFHDASLACAKAIYGSITFYDKTLTGTVELDYQTIGGTWVLNDNAMLQILANRVLNPRITTWEQVVDLPFQFPTIDHDWNLVDLVGASEMVAAIDGIRDAILLGGATGLAAHLADLDNPHQTTKVHVGLGSVQNYAVASQAEAQAAASNIRYMTPLRTREAIEQLVLGAFTAHATNHLNPHNVTATQLGLGLVQNYGVATVLQAQTGDATNVYMTPALTRAAIQAQVTTSIEGHVENVDNPHNTTKTQVGLGDVLNYGVATTLEARAGMVNNKYMTPALVREAITSQVVNAVSDHVNLINNPHLVTKEQVELGEVQNYPIASSADAQAGLVNDRYMTPYRTFEAIDSRIGTAYQVHVSHTDNPHLVTKDQVGLGNVQNYPIASQLQAEQGVVATAYMTPALTRQAIQAYESSNARSRLIFAERTNDLDDTWTPVASWEHPTTGSYQTDGFAATLYMSNGKFDMTQYRLTSDRRGYVSVELESGNVGFMTFEKEVVAVDGFNSRTTIYVRSPANRQEINVVIAYDPASRLTDQIAVLSVPPANSELIAVTKRIDQMMPLQARGSLFFNDVEVSAPGLDDNTAANYIPQWQQGALTHYVNVINAAADRAAAQAHLVSPHHYINFEPWAFRDTRVASTGTLAIQDAASYQFISTMAQDSEQHLQTYLSQYALKNYRFEVELSSTNEGANAMGVCAAAVEYNGRIVGIYAMRTPGGIVLASQNDQLEGGNIYQLFTVGLNLFHNGATMLAGGNDGLTWGDGIAAEDRESEGPYVATGNGWNQAGNVRIRVTRTDDILLIETTDLDSTTYVAAQQVLLNLGDAGLEMFNDRPSRFGFASFAQGGARFQVLSAPHHYRPYVEVIPGESIDQDVVNYHNGIAWETMDPYSPENPIRPGRLYVSQLAGSEGLYSAQRNHYLTKIASLN